MVRINYTEAETGENVSRYNVEGTELRSNELYIQIYVFWMKFLIVELLPYISILLLNSIMIVRRVTTHYMRDYAATLRCCMSDISVTDADESALALIGRKSPPPNATFACLDMSHNHRSQQSAAWKHMSLNS